MRRCISLVMAAAAVALLVPSPSPAQALPVGCLEPCEVRAGIAGYVAPVVVVPSGTAVRWTSLDTSHPTADVGAAECFRVQVGPGVEPTPVRFVVDGDTLTAASGDAAAVGCANAVATPAAFVLPFHCLIHPWMNGSLVVPR